MPGVTARLVDDEGFPRSDIDVHLVRSQRSRLAVLRTDSEQLLARIEASLHRLLPPGPSESTLGDVREPTSSPHLQSDSPPPPPRAFASVGSVQSESAADRAGLRPGDGLISLGTVCLATIPNEAEAMEALRHYIRRARGSVVTIEFRRRSRDQGDEIKSIEVELGNEGLGCHIIPLVN
mmetsp:Transcript_16419/g.33475  ORF Transcript_16419/g.33475 Transcript_16419/m.33475 type:complete len:179 (+) Transcript_16419:354-890(+)